ncbi:tyrosine-type recombinase/integrase [Altererythrobacter confluentis]|uniref:Tyrosine-type recombinase/integrase n=1 Tax=Allopontixanthobacter confluentis TaxID=1849021 RepID=A0A6L7GI02_9SPHN|nr:tyrosine-type recombinase/integrase [Allopontixanthobacter confluentis]MXP15693.1 tyrosine-type recombinase/integrase [Allopontixanthobacter confluentis]
MELKLDYLRRDKKSGLLTYRRRFPQELVPFIPSKSPSGSGRKELKVSLKASSMNHPVARARYEEAERMWGEIVDQARKRASGTFDQLDAETIAYLASHVVNEGLEIDAEVRLLPEPADRKKQRAQTLAAVTLEDLTEWREMRAVGDIEGIIGIWGYEAASLAEVEGFRLDQNSPSHVALCSAIHDAQIAASEGTLERLKGNSVPTPLIAKRPAKAAQIDKIAISIFDIYERYAAVPGRSLKTVAQWRRYIKHLVDFVGTDNILAMQHDDLVAWRNHLRDHATYKGKRFSAKTINGSYLGAVNAVFAWAKGDAIIPANPMLEVAKVKLPKAPRTRGKGFTSEEALTILRASLQPPTSNEKEDLRNAKRWCPWIMAYSGARVNEITQLRKQDIFEQDGVWVMRITPEAGTVKNKESRLVPLHSHLRAQGFLKFVEERSDGPLFYNPAKRRSDNAINRQANRLGSKLAEWVRSVGIVGVMPNHAWRHHFISQAVRYRFDPAITRALTGHASGDVHGDYEHVGEFVDVLSREIELIPPFKV